jgi:S1-C subfamily serine protease
MMKIVYRPQLLHRRPHLEERFRRHTMTNDNAFLSLSQGMAQAAETAGASIVRVEARRRLPATGIVYAAGLVLTASHVVEREDDIRVGLPAGQVVVASLVGRDPGSDLAVLRLTETADLPSAAILREPARVGQLVLALGRPGDDGIQASLGVVSAVRGPARAGRGSLLDQYIRTDAVPYPGFSGGPLVDAAGQVIGVNTSGLARSAALTLPAEMAWQVAAALAEHGYVRRGYLGIRSQPVEIPAAQQDALGRAQRRGLLLVGIEEDSPAQSGGLLVGDIVTAIQDQPVSDPEDLSLRLARAPGQALPIQVLRGGRSEVITVTIGERKPGA